MDLVLGLDVGGTASRALVTTLDGARVGYGRAGAGNPVAATPAVAQANVTAAAKAALSNVEHSRVAAIVVGAAGAAGSDIFHKSLAELGLQRPLRVVGDVVVAFAAGTTEPRGTVLIAGTGAVAAEIEGFAELRVADGLGWLLGDLGSAFWLGREAASATARELAAGRRHGKLVDLVCEAIGERDPDPFVIAVHAQPPRQLATLAPLVTSAAEAADPLALDIVERAARHLVDTVASVREPSERTPIVLAGSVLAHCAPLSERVRSGLAGLWPRAALDPAQPGEIGAARLAVRLLNNGV